MSGRLARDVALPSALYLLCAGWAAAYLRLLVDPAPDWRLVVGAVVGVGACAWLLRLVRPPAVRAAATAFAAIGGLLAIAGARSGAWPWREDLRGADGYLGAGGYVADLLDVARNAGAAWVRIVFPADAVGEPDAVAAVRVVALLVLVVCAAGLIAFRVPLMAVGAVAGAVMLVSLFVAREQIALQGAALCLLGLTVLCAMPGRASPARQRVGLLAAAGLAGAAIALSALPGVAPSGVLDWQRWQFREPTPVNVGFVWNQQLTAIDFGDEVTQVLEVDDPKVDYLRVGVLERFDGFRWQAAQRVLSTGRTAQVDVPPQLLPPVLREDRAPERTVEIRNLAVLTRDLPLPIGTTAIGGLAGAVRPVTLASGGSVVLTRDLPVGSTYSATVADRALTPAILDADVLGAPTDPRQAALEDLTSLALTGRHADPDGPGPWNADHADRQSSRPTAPAAATAATPRSKPDPADLTLDGAVYPAFGEPGREAQVQRVIRQQITGDLFTISPIDGWRKPYATARKLTARAETPYQAAVILEHWFQTEFSYDETATYGGTSVFGPLPAFLGSERRAAHCQYFAGSMAVLLRMLGIPARVAFGFAQGKLDGDRRVITNRDAHAWVEVRFPYAGWVAFEPTPSRRLASSTSSTSSAFGASDIVQPGGSLAGLADGANLPNGVGPNRGAPTSSAAALPLVETATASSPWPRRALYVAGLAVAVALLGLLIWLAKSLSALRARTTDDPRRVAMAARAEIADWLGDQGVAVPDLGAAGVGDRAKVVYAVPTERWVKAVTIARFGAPDEAARSMPVVRAETRQLVGGLRRSCTRAERVRGAVRPRGLVRR